MFRVCNQQSKVLKRQILRNYIKHTSRCASVKVTDSKILGVRREDLNVWERRAPIAPQHVKELIDQGKTQKVVPIEKKKTIYIITNLQAGAHFSLFY